MFVSFFLISPLVNFRQYWLYAYVFDDLIRVLMWVLFMYGLAASWIITFLAHLSVLFNAALIDASLQFLLFIAIFMVGSSL